MTDPASPPEKDPHSASAKAPRHKPAAAPDPYAATVLTPKTEFPMRADLATREPLSVARWRETDVYGRALARRRQAGAPPFVLHDGPPYANGNIHHGHVLNKVLKDIVVKFHALSGHYAPYVPGWDCHGLPIEQKILEEIRAEGRDFFQVEPAEIRRRCRDYAARFLEVQKGEFQRMLVLGDFDKPYRTMDFAYQATIARGLARWIEGGFLYAAKRPVLWDPVYRTALAEAEVEYPENHQSPSIYVAFPFTGTDAATLAARVPEAAGLPCSIVIWTTTPWTLPANLAVALHPEFRYALVVRNSGESRQGYIVAEKLVPVVATACGWMAGDHTIAATFSASALAGISARHPWIARDSRIVFADYVTLDAGTGCVHTAPGHGVDDFRTGLKEGLDIYAPVDDAGCFTPDVERYAGQFVFAANKTIVADLHASGALLSSPDLKVTHKYPYSWRSDKPVIFRATPQWFLKLDHAAPGEADTIRRQALVEIREKVQWIPAQGQARIESMVEHRPDWCISRQRAWGVPIPVFHCLACGADHIHAGTAHHVADLFAEHGADIWWTWEADKLLPPHTRCEACGEARLAPRRDIVDVWFDSGSSYAALLAARPDLGLPERSDLYLEGSDQHRGWFNSSLMCHLRTHGQAPYKAVLTHGFVLGDDGEKLSKRKKNFLALDKVLAQDGAEILRLWVASCDFGGDMRFGRGQLDQLGDAYRKIRNTFRFLLGNLHDFDPTCHTVDRARLPTLDAWAWARLDELSADVIAAYAAYELHKVHQLLLDFCNVELSGLYLDALKDTLYCDAPDDERRRSSQTVLFAVARRLCELYAPILSHTADEAWSHLPAWPDKPDSVLLSDLPRDATLAESDREILVFMNKARSLRDRVLVELEGLRARKEIGKSLDALVEFATTDADTHALLHHPLSGSTPAESAAFWARLLIVSEVIWPESPAGAATVVTARRHGGARCPRCWTYTHRVAAAESAHPGTCPRCADVLIRISAPPMRPPPTVG